MAMRGRELPVVSYGEDNMSKPEITEKQIRNRADAKSFSKGKEYFRARAIYNTVRRGATLEAYCQGSDYTPYRVQATIQNGAIVAALCTCPYDWGGDCKHIVALLLTYLDDPSAFEERATLHEQLEKRSKDDLITLIQDMIERYPALRDLVDTPTPAQVSVGEAVDTTVFRKQMEQARYSYDGYDDPQPYRVLNSIIRTAERFAEQQDWENALRIYSTIVEETTPDNEYYIHDDEGDFMIQVTEVLEAIVAILEKPDVADDDNMRQIGLDALIRAEIWDINAGGVSLTDAVYDEMFVLIRPADVPAIRQKIEAAKAIKSKQRHGQWGVEAYERRLLQLDAIEGVDDEAALERLRESDIPTLIVKKLLELGRHEEALSVIDTQMTYRGDWLEVLPHLVEAGLADEAVQRVEAKLQGEYDDWLIGWLIQHYGTTDNQAALYRWLWIRFENIMGLQAYQELKTTAQTLNQWESTQAEVLAKVRKEKRYDTLLRIYMHEEQWQKAWDTLPQLIEVQTQYRYTLPSLELELARESQEQFPQKAIEVYTKNAYRMIEQRNRSTYAEAADFLVSVRDLYHDIGDGTAWENLIRKIRDEYNRLPALQDELNKAGLEK
jgi:uncharacterized Zn finger protein